MRAAFKARKSIGEHRKRMGEHRKGMGEHRADKNKESRNSDLSRLNAALLYAAEGWPVVPLHSKMMSRVCTCGNAACDKPGMHPRTEHGVGTRLRIPNESKSTGHSGQTPKSASRPAWTQA
jgi:hypothetical protein